MTNPDILYQNLLSKSQQGRGDGTIYAWGSSAAPVVADKTFVLTTVNIMTDLGADANDKFNGYELKFTATDRRYLITDWVAASDLATTLEVPNLGDTGAWTIRRTLFTDDFAPANPIQYAQDGLLFQKWIDKAANNTAAIYAALPNLIDDGGFELNSLTDYWTIRGAGGSATVAVNAGSPILGTYDCKWNRGDQSYIGIEQAGKGPLRKGYTYGIIVVTGGDGGVVTDFRISMEYVSAGDATRVPVTFTEINSGDDTATANIWKPAIADTNRWDEITFVVGEDLATGTWKFVLDQYDLTDCFADEIYIWEIGPTPSDNSIPNPDTLIIAGHNMAGGFASPSDLDAYRCPVGRTGGPDAVRLIDLDANVIVDGNLPIYENLNVQTSIYPILTLTFAAISGKTFEAAELWVGKRWEWDAHVAGDWLPNDGDIEIASRLSLSGIRRVSHKWERRMFSGQVRGLSAEQYTEWLQFIAYVKLNRPFWFRTPAIANRGIVAELLFMRNIRRPELTAQLSVATHASFRFEEIIGDSN